MKKEILILTGTVLIIFAALWQLVLVPRLTQRIPPGWTWEADFIGTMTLPDPETGNIPEKDDTAIYQRRMYIASESNRPRSVDLEDTFYSLDPENGKKIWEYIYRAEVDPQTGAHLQKEYLGDYYVFPQFVEKTTYKFRNNYIKGVPLAFRREEEVEGLQTYLFSCHGRGEYTESYAGTADYPGVKVEPGEEIKCADDQFSFNAWVEPITGKIVKLRESCFTGDYVYEIATGKRLSAVERWDGETAGDDNIRRAAKISQDRQKLLLFSRYIPITLLLGGFLCFGLMLIPAKFLENTDV